MSFEKDLVSIIQKKIISDVAKAEFVKVDYQSRKQMPNEFVSRIWESIDWNEVIEAIRPEMQRRICNALIGAMETEIKTDVKKVLSVQGVREKIRIEVYPKLMKVLDSD